MIYCLIVTLEGVEIPHVNIFDYLTNHYLSLETPEDAIPDPTFTHTDIFLGYDSDVAQSGLREETKGFFWDTSQNQTYLILAIRDTLDVTNPKHVEMFDNDDRIDKLIIES